MRKEIYVASFTFLRACPPVKLEFDKAEDQVFLSSVLPSVRPSVRELHPCFEFGSLSARGSELLVPPSLRPSSSLLPSPDEFFSPSFEQNHAYSRGPDILLRSIRGISLVSMCKLLMTTSSGLFAECIAI